MPVTVTLYNDSSRRHQAGDFPASDTYVCNLYSALPENGTATTKSAAESSATQLTSANGYTQNSKQLTGVVIEAIDTNDSRFTCDPIVWDASGGSISATHALIYNDSKTGDPPFVRIAFGATITAADGIQFRITPDPSGGLIKLNNSATPA